MVEERKDKDSRMIGAGNGEGNGTHRNWFFRNITNKTKIFLLDLKTTR
jgi:hypothetical protein